MLVGDVHALWVTPTASDLPLPDQAPDPGHCPALEVGPLHDLLRVNCPDGPFVPVGGTVISGCEVEIRRLVDAVRRIVAMTCEAKARPPGRGGER